MRWERCARSWLNGLTLGLRGAARDHGRVSRQATERSSCPTRLEPAASWPDQVLRRAMTNCLQHRQDDTLFLAAATLNDKMPEQPSSRQGRAPGSASGASSTAGHGKVHVRRLLEAAARAVRLVQNLFRLKSSPVRDVESCGSAHGVRRRSAAGRPFRTHYSSPSGRPKGAGGPGLAPA